MSNEQDTAEWQQARDAAISAIKVKNLPQVGPAPVGRWTGIGVARKLVMEALGLSADEAAALLGEHLGKTVPFRFAEWKITLSLKLEGFAAQPMAPLRGAWGAPDFSLDMFRMLFFWKNEIDQLQWSAGTFGGLTGGKWWHVLSGQRVTVHEFTVHGTVIDELALVRSLGIPHDEAALTINPSAAATPEVEAIGNKRGGGRRKSAKWDDWVAALAIEASNGNVRGDMTQTALHDLISNRLGSWEIDEIPRTTVNGALAAILKRLQDEGI